MAVHLVKCSICQESFDTEKEEFVKTNSRRYAHKRCFEEAESKKLKEEKDKEELIKYIQHLFSTDTLNPRVFKQIKEYKEKYNYTYAGILRSLKYHFEIQHGDINKANDGIGIVPYVYKDAYNYYRALWEAHQRNEDKDIEKYKPVEVEIKAVIPKRNIKKRKFFSFLDNDEV